MRTQKRPVRLCFFLTVIDMYTLELGVFMFRFTISDLPVAFKEYFKKRSETTNIQPDTLMT